MSRVRQAPPPEPPLAAPKPMPGVAVVGDDWAVEARPASWVRAVPVPPPQATAAKRTPAATTPTFTVPLTNTTPAPSDQARTALRRPRTDHNNAFPGDPVAEDPFGDSN